MINDFSYYLKAGFPYFYIETYEADRCIEDLKKETKKYNSDAQIFVWDITSTNLPPDPMEILNKIKESKTRSIFILKNYNWFMVSNNSPNPFIIQFFQNNYESFCSGNFRKSIVIVSDSPFDSIPTSIKKHFIDLKFDLPNEKEVSTILNNIVNIASKNPKFDPKKCTKELKERIVDAALGMTAQAVENSLALCVIQHGKLIPKVIDRIKAQDIEGTAGVKYTEYDSSFSELKGLDNLKFFVIKTINHLNSKGIILLGPCGTGKTYFAQCLSNETGMRMLTVEMAEFQGGIVGETEQKVRQAIKAIRAMAGTKGVIILVDEIEKALSGIGNQTVSSDSITARAMGQWLKFMQDPGCKVYFIATCNDISKIPPEYLRAERWDTAPFFVDLPNIVERETIITHYMKTYNVKGKIKADNLEGWSGAEIKALCRIADMMKSTTDEVIDFIVPMSKTAEKQIQDLRSWAVGNTIPATRKITIGKTERELSL